MIDFVKEGRVGDKVRNLEGDVGIITDLNHNDEYPVLVNYSADIYKAYTAKGLELISYSQPSLMFANGSVTIDQGTPPERESERLCCGLTNKRWQRVIDGEFMLGFSDESIELARDSVCTHTLQCYPGGADGMFLAKAGTTWTYAAIPDMIGIRKPHFGGVGPRDPEQAVVVKVRAGFWMIGMAAEFAWSWFETTEEKNRIIEYIELP